MGIYILNYVSNFPNSNRTYKTFSLLNCYFVIYFHCIIFSFIPFWVLQRFTSQEHIYRGNTYNPAFSTANKNPHRIHTTLESRVTRICFNVGNLVASVIYPDMYIFE